MGTTHVNVIVRDFQCTPIKDCRMMDLAVLLCNGTPLFDFFPIVDQLKKRYATPVSVEDFTNYPLTVDQGGMTLQINSEILTFSSPAMSQVEIYSQMKNFFTGVNIDMVNGQIKIETKERGPAAVLTISGSCSMVFGPTIGGEGYQISIRYYHDAQRINIIPPAGEFVNHIELDIPVGCYKIWARVCHGKNEETSIAMVPIENCGGCRTVNLMLPEVMNCAKDAIYPVMEKIAVEYIQVFPELTDRAKIMQGLAQVANLNKTQILAELEIRRDDAELLNRTDLIARVDAIIAIADALPQYC